MELDGKVALVTGGAKRVGRAIALALARNNADIFLHYNHSVSEAEKTAVEIRALGKRCELFQADLSKSQDILKLTTALFSKNHTIDFLINSASIFPKTPFETLTESSWNECLDTNLKAPLLLSHFLLDHPKLKGR